MAACVAAPRTDRRSRVGSGALRVHSHSGARASQPHVRGAVWRSRRRYIQRLGVRRGAAPAGSECVRR
eukprot:4587246-Prymnesium_polylepis.1